MAFWLTIDLDNICERKVDVDFEPIEIERFGGKDRYIFFLWD